MQPPVRWPRTLATVALIATSLLVPVAATAHAQSRDSVELTVRVVDSAGAVLSSADVSVRTRAGLEVARAQTDSTGRAKLVVDVKSSAEVLLVRRLGFLPHSQGLPLPLNGSMSVAVVLANFAVALDTVTVTAREALRRRTYYIDSATISKSSQLIRDGWDVVTKLRPDIAYGRAAGDYCPGVENVFVNGRWIVPETVLINPIAVSRANAGSSAITPHLPPRAMSSGDRTAAMSVLLLIKPEHIAQMTFRDCRDKEIAGPHSRSALFIVLAPGIGFDPAIGSFRFKP